MNLKSIILDKIKLNGKLIPLQFSILEKMKKNNFVFVFDEVGCEKTIEAGIIVWDTEVEKFKIVLTPLMAIKWYCDNLEVAK